DGLLFGSYTVEEVTPPEGYEPADPATQPVTVGAPPATCADRGASVTFSNAPIPTGTPVTCLTLTPTATVVRTLTALPTNTPTTVPQATNTPTNVPGATNTP